MSVNQQMGYRLDSRNPYEANARFSSMDRIIDPFRATDVLVMLTSLTFTGMIAGTDFNAADPDPPLNLN
eukprot:gene17317-20610_t